MNARPELLFVPGAFHGAWVWHDVCGRMRDDGWRVRAVDLPTSSGGNPDIGMYDDAAYLRRILAATASPTTIVAHSYGGIPAAQAAAGLGHVVKLIYVAAFLLDAGASLLSALDWQVPPWWTIEGLRVRPDNPTEIFYQDLDADAAARYAEQLHPRP